MPDKQKAKPVKQTLHLVGRLDGHRQVKSDSGDFYSNEITTPAVDEYSHPQRYAVNAPAPLGADGTEIDIVVDVRTSNRKRDGILYFNLQLWANLV